MIRNANKMGRRRQIRSLLIAAILCVSVFCFLSDAKAASNPTDSASGTEHSRSAPVIVIDRAAVLPEPPAPERGFSMRRLRFKRPPIGFGYGAFIPSSGKTRNRFGGHWFGFGIGIGKIEQAVIPGRVSFHFGFTHQTAPGAYVWIVPLGVKYERALVHHRTLTPFVGATLDLEPVSLRSDPDNIRAGYHLAFGGTVFTGVNITRRAYLRVDYDAITRVEGFDFSGFNVGGGVRF
ncbi:MAG TPA: hypothetical protein VFJ58_25200 [Armatimonadota bacterium]|nr:hypothetical protein [Armatimonadota bacterium]